MYLPASAILRPPPEGWPNITLDSMQNFQKSDEVITLLKHLPYISDTTGGHGMQGAPWCTFADYRSPTMERTLAQGDPDRIKGVTEGDVSDAVPPHVVGLTAGGRDSMFFLLDTHLGVVYWLDCPDGPRHSPAREQVSDDPYEWAPEEEADWRADSPAWTVCDFFEVLKTELRHLNAVPLDPWRVWDIYSRKKQHLDGVIAMVQGVYREHGWPDLQSYRKEDCLEAIQTALRASYPDLSSDG